MTSYNSFASLFDDLQKNINNATGKVPLNELFPASFMNSYTDFSDFDELLSAGGFTVSSQEDFDAIPESELDKHISKTTKFSSWNEMSQKAAEIRIMNAIG